VHFHKRPVDPYVVPLDDEEKTAYSRLRIAAAPVAA